MRNARRPAALDVALPVAVAAVTLAAYVWTVAPSIAPLRDTVDSAELVSVAHVLGVAHPPGAAIWLPLARVALVLLPFDEPALRTNLLSAALMAAASGLVVVAARSWLRSTPPWAAAMAGLTFGFAPIPWSQALVTEVLALQALLLAAALALAPGAAEGRRWPAFALVLGLLAWNHPTGLALAVPLGLACASRRRPRGRRGLIAAVLFLAPGVYTVAYVLLRSGAPIAWGDTSTLAGVWAHLTGSGYREAIEWNAAEVTRDLPEAVRRALRQSPPLLWVLVPAGALAAARARPRLGVALLAAVAATVVFVAAYRVAGREDYLALAAMALALGAAWGAAEGWAWLRSRLPDRATAAALALGAAGFLVFWIAVNGSAVSLRGDRALVDAAIARLEAAEPGARIETARDEDTFPLWYARVVLGLRPDVTIEDVRGLAPVIEAEE